MPWECWFTGKQRATQVLRGQQPRAVCPWPFGGEAGDKFKSFFLPPSKRFAPMFPDILELTTSWGNPLSSHAVKPTVLRCGAEKDGLVGLPPSGPQFGCLPGVSSPLSLSDHMTGRNGGCIQRWWLRSRNALAWWRILKVQPFFILTDCSTFVIHERAVHFQMACFWTVLSRKQCSENNVWFQWSMMEVLSFIQKLSEKGLSFSALEVYLAATSSCHVGFNGILSGVHPLMIHYWKVSTKCRLSLWLMA